MTAVSTKIVLDPTKEELERQIESARERMADMRGPHKEASIMLDGWVQRNFRSEGGNVGGWLPLKAGGRWRRGVGLDTSAKLLQDTGRLRISFRPWATDNDAGIGSEIPYSINHEDGLGVPQRRMLPIRSEVAAALSDLFDKHVVKNVRRQIVK